MKASKKCNRNVCNVSELKREVGKETGEKTEEAASISRVKVVYTI